MVKKYRVLFSDDFRRIVRGEIGLALENDFPEKYFAKLHLGVFQYYEEHDDQIHVHDRVFYFHEGEIEEIGESKIRLGKSLADDMIKLVEIFGFGTEFHSIGTTSVVKDPINTLSAKDRKELKRLGWKKSKKQWVYDRI